MKNSSNTAIELVNDTKMSLHLIYRLDNTSLSLVPQTEIHYTVSVSIYSIEHSTVYTIYRIDNRTVYSTIYLSGQTTAQFSNTKAFPCNCCQLSLPLITH